MIDYLFLFIFGLVIGSFLKVVIDREIKEESDGSENESSAPKWLWGRSKCDYCQHTLSWYDNIPLFSYLWLQGRCRYCKKRIGYQYPLVEFLTAFQFIWIYYLLKRLTFFPQLEGVHSLLVLGFWLFIFTLSIALIIIDWRISILPDTLVFSGIFVALLRLFYTGRWEFIYTAIGAFLFFLLLYGITRGKGMGFGDVKLSFFIGLVLGWWQWVVISLFLAFFSGAVFGILAILIGSKSLKSAIPFGPFLLISMLIVKIWGDFLATYTLPFF